MRVTVHYRAQLRQAIGRPSEQLDVAIGATVGDLLKRLGERSTAGLLVFVNDEQADATQPLRDGDRVTVLAPMAGG